MQAFLVVLPFLFATTLGQGTRLPGEFIDVSARGDKVVAITDHHQIVELNNGKWESLKGAATEIAAASDGQHFILNHFTGARAQRFTTKTKVFGPAGVNNAQLNYINAATGSSAVGIVAVSKSGAGCLAVFAKKGKAKTPTWNIDDKDCNNREAAIGVDGDGWKVDNNGGLFHLEGGKFVKKEVTGAAADIAHVDAQDAKNVVVVDGEGKVFKYDGAAWSPVTAGTSPAEQASINAKAIYVLDEEGQIYEVTGGAAATTAAGGAATTAAPAVTTAAPA